MDILPFFENYGLPSIVIGVLFGILWYKIKQSDKQQNDMYQTLCSVIKEQSAVIAGNTTAFNNLTITLADISNNQTKVSALLERLLYNSDAPKFKQQADS